jgi:hypothetical protein
MPKRPTPEYASTRILLELGIAAAIVTVVLALAVLLQPPFMGEGPATVFGLPQSLVIGGVALIGALLGLGWMIRIFRGPRDEPPPWRHRDR